MPLLNERDVKTRIDEQLKNLEWIDNPSLPNRNVYKQNPKTDKQKKALGSKRPDYILYRDNSDDPLIVIANIINLWNSFGKCASVKIG